jgi:hypothetical protein
LRIETDKDPTTSAFPAEVELILSAMDAARYRGQDRRHLTRLPYRVVGELRLYSDPDGPPAIIYTRDVDPRGLGFLTRERLPLGYGGTLTLSDPDGRPLSIGCSIYRCREAVPGWYEGALYFNRQQSRFTG